MEEKWMCIKGFDNYSISNLGNVRNNTTERILRLYTNHADVVMVGLRDEQATYTRSVKVLVAEAFVDRPNEFEFDTPMLLDGDSSNCLVDNIVWRPRWFVWKYAQNFKISPKLLNMALVDDRGELYSDVLQASVKHGLLCIDIRQSVFTGSPVFPSWLIFSMQ